MATAVTMSAVATMMTMTTAMPIATVTMSAVIATVPTATMTMPAVIAAVPPAAMTAAVPVAAVSMPAVVTTMPVPVAAGMTHVRPRPPREKRAAVRMRIPRHRCQQTHRRKPDRNSTTADAHRSSPLPTSAGAILGWRIHGDKTTKVLRSVWFRRLRVEAPKNVCMRRHAVTPPVSEWTRFVVGSRDVRTDSALRLSSRTRISASFRRSHRSCSRCCDRLPPAECPSPSCRPSAPTRRP